MLEKLLEIDHVVLNISADNRLLLNLTIAIIMFGVSLDLTLDDFRVLLRKPRPVLTGIFSQFLILPLLTTLLALLLRNQITPTVGLGMVLVASCPGGNVSNFMSSLAKGNVALSVSLTAFSTVAGLLMTPFNFAFWGNIFLQFYKMGDGSGLMQPISIDPFSVFQTIVVILGIPLTLGVLFKLRFPQTTELILVWVKRFSILVFTAMILVIFVANLDQFVRYIEFIFLIVMLHNALALSQGYYLGKWLGLSHRDRKTIAIETGIQNSGLALALLLDPEIFPVDVALGGMVFIAAWWGVWHIISGLTIAGFWSGFSLKK